MKKIYTGADFCISTNFRKLNCGLFAEQPPKTYSAHVKETWELIGDDFKSFEEARAAIRKFCEEHNAIYVERR
jgi:hypothetical protein